MAINCVYLSTDVYMVCMNHALSTEKEEVMGLLIGEIDEDRISHISAVIMLIRSDKRKDRVEISPEQLSDATNKAERLTQQLNRPMRVVGWYHSHPHITVVPSHVDVQTQAMYQMMDEGFVGLIFSVFNEDKNSLHNKIQLTCFQSFSASRSPNGESSPKMKMEIPVKFVPSDGVAKHCLDSLVELSSILRTEEDNAYSQSKGTANTDVLSMLHNSAVYTKSLCHITEVFCVPLLQALEARLQVNNDQINRLTVQREQLLKLVEMKSEK